MRMGPRDKPYGGSTKRIEHQGIYNDTQERGSAKLMVEQTIESRSHSRIKIKICSTLLLYSKERRITKVGTRLHKAQSGYDKGQNTTAIN